MRANIRTDGSRDTMDAFASCYEMEWSAQGAGLLKGRFPGCFWLAPVCTGSALTRRAPMNRSRSVLAPTGVRVGQERFAALATGCGRDSRTYTWVSLAVGVQD